MKRCETYRVHSCHIEPRRRYQTISRSLFAYSARSRDEDEEGTLLKFLDKNSRARAVSKGRLDLRSDANITARITCESASRNTSTLDYTIDEWTESVKHLCCPIFGGRHRSYQRSGRLYRRGCESLGKEIILNGLG